jgi:hypothetical protein
MVASARDTADLHLVLHTRTSWEEHHSQVRRLITAVAINGTNKAATGTRHFTVHRQSDTFQLVTQQKRKDNKPAPISCFSQQHVQQLGTPIKHPVVWL